MNYLNDVFLSTIFLLFPIMVYLFYVAYNKNIEKDENKLIFCFALFSSIYLILDECLIYYSRIGHYMANIAVIIAYLKKCPKEAILLSLFYIFIVYDKYNLNVYYLSIEYILYFIIYIFKNKMSFNDYIYILICYLIKIIISLAMNNQIYNDNIIITIIITLIETIFITFIIKKGDSILKYHIAYKELVQEKQIRTSLFKITHEIKNPLAVCKGYFDMLDLDNVDQCQKYVPIIKDEVNHALLILNDFSDLSKIKIEKDIIDINYVLEETISNLKELLKFKNIKIVYNNDNEIYIEGDYTRLMQVFINIIKNSIEALNVKKNKKITIKLEETKNNVCIIFNDTGCGMSEEVFKNFDKPFYTTKINGTGLGTTLSKEIIEAHNGKISYESVLNKGTTVKIILPKMTTSLS